MQPITYNNPNPPASPWHLAPSVLDRLADAELQHGHHGAAERLAIQAAELRESAR